jgi:hypothetical protein
MDVPRLRLAPCDGNNPPIFSEPTPQWEFPLDSCTPAWDPSFTPRHDSDSDSTSSNLFPGSPLRDIQSADESAVCQPSCELQRVAVYLQSVIYHAVRIASCLRRLARLR